MREVIIRFFINGEMRILGLLDFLCGEEKRDGLGIRYWIID